MRPPFNTGILSSIRWENCNLLKDIFLINTKNKDKKSKAFTQSEIMMEIFELVAEFFNKEVGVEINGHLQVPMPKALLLQLFQVYSKSCEKNTKFIFVPKEKSEGGRLLRLK